MRTSTFTVAYARVSTPGQNPENQLAEIEAAGYRPDATYTDIVSGKAPAAERPEFAAMLAMLARLRGPRRLIVSKLDRLGRDAADVLATVRRLEGIGCAVRVLQLGELDLTTTAGKMVLATLSAVAEMERDLLVERTRSGLERARQAGKPIGRPRALRGKETRTLELLAAGHSVSAVARELAVSRATVIRARDAAAVSQAEGMPR
jgi:putative DNA-invertase from lambdoid prophage Rac